MDFQTLSRRDLQTLCKRNKIAANMTNVAMADALQALPLVEGLEAIIQEAQNFLSPKREEALGSLDALPRTCRRTSARREPNPTGSSLPRTRQGTARRASKNEAADDAQAEADADFIPAIGIPNSPPTLNTRGRRTRALITTEGLEQEEEEEAVGQKKREEGKGEPQAEAGAAMGGLVPKTPATRVTRGRAAVTQIAKSSEEGTGNQEEGGGPAVLQTPAASTARRASTRRGTREAPAVVETTRRRTRQSARRAIVDAEDATEPETAALANTTASRKSWRRAKAADPDMVALSVLVAGEDGGEDTPPADPAQEEKEQVEALVSTGDAAADAAEPAAVDQTAEEVPEADTAGKERGPLREGVVHQTVMDDCINNPTAGVEEDVPGVDPSDETVERAKASDGATKVEEEKACDGSVDQMVGVDALEVPLEGSFDPTVDVVDSQDRTAEFLQLLTAAANATIHQTTDVAPSEDLTSPEEGDGSESLLDEPTLEEETLAGGMAMVTTTTTAQMEVSDVDQTAIVEEEGLGVVESVENSIDPTVEKEEVPAMDAGDQTVMEVSDPEEEYPRGDMLVTVEVEGHVDPTAQEIQVPFPDSDAEVGESEDDEAIDQTVEDGGIKVCEVEEEEVDEVGLLPLSAEGWPAGETPETDGLGEGSPAISQVAEVAVASETRLLPLSAEGWPAGETPETDGLGEGSPAISQVAEVAVASETLLPAAAAAAAGGRDAGDLLPLSAEGWPAGETPETDGLGEGSPAISQVAEVAVASETRLLPLSAEGWPAGETPETDGLGEGSPAISQVAEVAVASETLLPAAAAAAAGDVTPAIDPGEKETAMVGLRLSSVGGCSAGDPPEAEILHDAGSLATWEVAEVAVASQPETLLLPAAADVLDSPAAEKEEEGEEEEEAEKDGEGEKAADLVPGGELPPAENVDDDRLFFVQSMGGSDRLQQPLAVPDGENSTAVLLPLTGGAAAKQGKKKQQPPKLTVVEYNSTTSNRKLKAAVKEKILQLQAMEEKRMNNRAALATLDDNCALCPKQQQPY